MSAKRLKCFVAMRIGEKETDATYRKLIRPSMRELGIDARHVDDEEHNEDIDDRILKLLNQRDFVIADLTYARPSVYFEAGYAEAKDKPVVYTCRRDHFQGTKSSEYGELKVHFDLLMKNIVPWSDPNDVTFKARLQRRVKKAVQPILREKQSLEKERLEADSFSRLPLKARIKQLHEVCRMEAKALGYSGWSTDRLSLLNWLRISEKDYNHDYSEVIRRIRNLQVDWFGVKQRAGVVYVTYFVLVAAFGKNDMKGLSGEMLKAPVCDLAPLMNSKMKNTELREHLIICTFGKNDLTKFSAIIPAFSFQQNGRGASFHTKFEMPLVRNKRYFRAFVDTHYEKKFLGRKAGARNPELKEIEGAFRIHDQLMTFPMKRSITISALDSIRSIRDVRKGIPKALRAF